MSIDVIVGEPYPCWITFMRGEEEFRISHAELLSLESAVAEAKRQALCKLDQRSWHEIDPKLAQTG